MPRPLLTDDIVDEDKAARRRLEAEIKQGLAQPDMVKKYQKQTQALSKQQVYKSRRIENAKRLERRRKINQLIILLLIVFAIVLWIVFKI